MASPIITDAVKARRYWMESQIALMYKHLQLRQAVDIGPKMS